MVSVGVANIADAILVVGATAATWIGFNLPMMFYLKLYEAEYGSRCGWKRLGAHAVNLAFLGMSFISLYLFFIS